MTGKRPTQAGMTLLELAIAVAVGAIVLAALNSVVSLGLQAQTGGRQQNELVYQARFALERMITTARGVPPTKPLATPLIAGTTGDWFAPAGCVGAACVMFCRNTTSQQLIETTTTDTTCTGTRVIASNVSAFSAQLPPGAGVVDEPVATLSLTLASSAAPQTVTLSASVRLGGGTL